MRKAEIALKNILTEDRINEFLSIGVSVKIPKGEYYIREGETPKKLGFLLSGLFRYVYINGEGKEYTKGLVQERNFLTSYSAMIKETPSHFFVEALEDAEIFTISYEKWKALLNSDNFWYKFLVSFVEEGFVIKEKRERDLLLLNAETRYKDFLDAFPEIENRISQTIIASYLGIQPESLSRIRKKMNT
ncbi:cAMP-binding domain of CRP or a regulatory subunit of cAMP-dependent protein kinases [Tenacibaculum sp. MAR_2009_124]|uniref:Crp/Fnr family transcriptional regulator n=1 Tax=Tenacibaculum sp. MAR_2009_124 TaxID=1250059 RepID=UPI0008953736|nr:Crp/Fnr family transcriptional regulator [Tenacibaculum sp. MAR_2009_124]SEC94760.1 cAMP-binding domain of CRP or a regulatory subunit of cAMP-dependent protein kinases [Tenacibaculum sp. MAR_2009_124]